MCHNGFRLLKPQPLATGIPGIFEQRKSYFGCPALNGCPHIAIATLSRVEVLVSWNFRHIVNLQRIRGYNSVNLRHGYPLLEIRTPQEVIRYEEE